MRRRTRSLRIVEIALLLGSFAVSPSAAQEQQNGQEQEEYVSTADQETVLHDDLLAMPGKEAHVLRVALPPGWVGGWHYHTGDVFVYVLEGEFVVDVEGEARKRFWPGQVYHEAVKAVMQARNGSATVATRLLLFQVGDKGEPLMIKAKEPTGEDG